MQFPHKPVWITFERELNGNVISKVFFFARSFIFKIEMNLLWKHFHISLTLWIIVANVRKGREKERVRISALCMGKTKWNVLCAREKKEKYKFSYDFIFLYYVLSLLQVVYRFSFPFHFQRVCSIYWKVCKREENFLILPLCARWTVNNFHYFSVRTMMISYANEMIQL
jgi:hypothetical protein